MKAPSDFRRAPRNQEQPPAVKAELEWVYGFRGSNSKNNLKILADGSYGYFAAGVGVAYE